MTNKALVLGSGGMASAFSAGVLSVLNGKMPRESFDTVYGSSAGAFLAEMFAAGQVELLDEAFNETIASEGIVNWWNYLSSNGAINVKKLLKIQEKRCGTRFTRRAHRAFHMWHDKCMLHV